MNGLSDLWHHPKDNPEGCKAYGRGTYYVVGDRMRGTVLLITPESILEMTPQYAKKFAEEIATHADDVLVGATEAVTERPHD